MRAVKSVTIDAERRVIITFLDGSTETLYPNLICCDAEALRDIIKELLEEKADAIVQTIENVTVATFEDGADEALIKKLLVSIDPIQEGTGDPSPENVRPISGRTGLSVTRCGKNLLNLSGITIPTTALPLYVPIFVGENAVTLSSSAPTNTAGNANLFLLQGSVSSGASAATNGVSVGAPRTVNATGGYVTVAVRNHMGVNPVDYDNQLEIGSTATDYETYKGNTYSVNWETEAGTVYGGTLDAVSGVMSVDRQIINAESLTWRYDENYSFWRSDDLNTTIKHSASPSSVTGTIAEKYTSVSYTTLQTDLSYIGMGVATTGRIAIRNGDSILKPTGGICYELVSPIEYQLTPQEITTLLGDNNIWTNSSNILELEYVADTKLYIGESQSGTLGSGRQSISNTDLKPVTEKTLEDVSEAYKAETTEKETKEETEDERGE